MHEPANATMMRRFWIYENEWWPMEAGPPAISPRQQSRLGEDSDFCKFSAFTSIS